MTPPAAPAGAEELRRLFRETVTARSAGLSDEHLDFALSRFEEGERTLGLVRRLFPDLLRGRPRVLDLGSGNGGMLFPFAGVARTVACDLYADVDLRAFARRAGLPVGQVIGSAESLPFASSSLDLVLLAEVLEHLPAPGRACAEIIRVLRPGGVCMLSTPPRLVFARRRDPHFGIRFLLALPDRLQRCVARRLAPAVPYNVHHVYATTWGIARQFPRGTFRLHVISHRTDWTRHLSWNYLAVERLPT